MFADIEIALEVAGSEPTFRLTTGDGAVPRVTTLIMTDASAEELIWWLAPESFTAVQPFSIGEVDEEAVESLAAVEDIDPLADLPPSEVRHRRALAESAALQDATLLSLATLTYGQVPRGFRRSHPTSGPAPALVPGRAYCLAVMGGSDSGHLSFMP